MKFLFVPTIFLLAGCVSSHGIKVDDSKYQQIVEGKTTLAELKKEHARIKIKNKTKQVSNKKTLLVLYPLNKAAAVAINIKKSAISFTVSGICCQFEATKEITPSPITMAPRIKKPVNNEEVCLRLDSNTKILFA